MAADQANGAELATVELTEPVAPRRTLRHRAAWILADQAMSSVANAGLTIVIALKVSPRELGTFAVAFTIYTFAVALTQSLAGQVVIIGYSDAPDDEHRRVSAQAGGVALSVGLLGTVLLLGLLPVVSHDTRPVLLAVAVLLPALLLQDLWRTAFISRGDPRAAFVNDFLWTALQVVLIAGLVVRQAQSAAPYVWAWGLAAAVAAGYGIVQNGHRPRFRGGVAWSRHNRRLSLPIVANTIATLGATQVAFIGIAAVGSVAALGAIRAGQTLLGPLNIVSFAATAFAVPELVRRNLSRRGLVKAGVAISLTLVAVDLAWGGALLVIPASWGAKILGDSWEASRQALPGLLLFTCALSASTGAFALMRAIKRTDLLLWSGVLTGPLLIAFSVAGVKIGGASGAAYGFALAAAVAIPPTWALLGRGIRRLAPDGGSPAADRLVEA